MGETRDIGARKEKLSRAKRALLAQRLQGKRDVQTAPRGIPHVADRTTAPLSFTEQQMWLAQQWEPESAAYNRATALQLRGELDVHSLERCLSEIVRRHDVLRTTFPVADGQPLQRVGPLAGLSLPVEDLTHLPPEERLAVAEQRMMGMLREPFALESGPLYRVRLFRLDAVDHLFLFLTHHIVFDGWSETLFVNELCAVYGSFISGGVGTLPALPIQYADFAHWQRTEAQGETLKAQLAYWQEKLGGELPVLGLPTDRPRPPQQTYDGGTQSLILPTSLVGQLTTLSHQEGVTLFMILLAAFKVLLHRYTGQTDIVVGTMVAGRSRAEMEKLIGAFVNSLVLRTDLAGDPTFRQLLQRVRQVSLGAYAHQDLPFDMLVQELNPQRDLSRTPVYQVLFNMETFGARAQSAGGVRVTPFDLDTGVALFDLSVEVVERGTEIHCAFVYNTQLFDATTTERMVGHYLNLLQGAVVDPEQRVSELPLLSEAERRQVLVEWNDTAIAYSGDRCLHEMFEAQVDRTPDATALVFHTQGWTYQELDRWANRLAHRLCALGVGPESLVGVCLRRTPDMVAALLAILKAGGAYVPLDPQYPQDRLGFMLEDSRIEVLLSERDLQDSLPDHRATVAYLDEPGPTAYSKFSEERIESGVTPRNLAYVLFTSGSTGRPKGVAIEHRSAIALMQWGQRIYSAEELAGVLAATSISFDLSVYELFLTLSVGGAVILAENVLQMSELSAANRITLVNTAPSVMAQLLRFAEIPASVKTINLAGEPLPALLVDELYKRPQVQRVYDLYGPTEDTTYSTWTLRRPQGTVTIGRPIDNTQVYLLDAHMQLVPIGVPGEIYLGGAGLARGYLNRPELTAAKFVSNPFSSERGARLYRTGDLARYLPDGNLQFLGRIDNQVKVRGLRIELGEIEAVLEQYPAVSQVVVTARERSPGDKYLVAYVVMHESKHPTARDLRLFLGHKLPEYMLPSAFVFLDALPHTPNGKVDRVGLAALDHVRPNLEESFVAPRTPVQMVLAGIWVKVLGLETVGIHDDFFDLGGHSLLATQILSRLRDAFHVEIPLRGLFERPTIAGLSRLIELIPSVSGKCTTPDTDTAEDREELVL